MKRLVALVASLATAFCASPAAAAAPAPVTLKLYAQPPKGWEHPGQTEVTEGWPPDDHRMLRDVTEPTVTAYLPDKAKATGAGVVVAPGGGFMAVSIDQEGVEVARWLVEHGVAAFVIKYRVVATPHDKAAFFARFNALVGKTKSDPNKPLPGEAEATADGQAAFSLVKGRAAAFGVDARRLGFLGFSAGGFMAISLATGEGPRPAFVGDIYASVRPNVVVPRDAPPLFAAVAADDPLFGSVAVSPYAAWRAANRPVELHIYEHGGHGFGMRRQGTTSDTWIEAFYAWMKANGVLKPR